MPFVLKIVVPLFEWHSAGKERRIKAGITDKGENLSAVYVHGHGCACFIAEGLFGSLLYFRVDGQYKAVTNHGGRFADGSQEPASGVDFNLPAAVTAVQFMLPVPLDSAFARIVTGIEILELRAIEFIFGNLTQMAKQ